MSAPPGKELSRLMITPSPRIAGFLGAILILLLRAAPALPATVVPLSLEQMESLSSEVIVGTVEDTRASWDRDHRIIETRVRIRVERRLKGPGAAVVHVVVPGGVVGDVGMSVPGTPVFRAGERVLLLAEPKGRRPGEIRPVGLFQGKLEVKRDERGEDVVEPPGPAWGSRGEPLPAAGAVPALPLGEVIRRLGGRP
jgi:hypothetical protein